MQRKKKVIFDLNRPLQAGPLYHIQDESSDDNDDNNNKSNYDFDEDDFSLGNLHKHNRGDDTSDSADDKPDNRDKKKLDSGKKNGYRNDSSNSSESDSNDKNYTGNNKKNNKKQYTNLKNNNKNKKTHKELPKKKQEKKLTHHKNNKHDDDSDIDRDGDDSLFSQVQISPNILSTPKTTKTTISPPLTQIAPLTQSPTASNMLFVKRDKTDNDVNKDGVKTNEELSEIVSIQQKYIDILNNTNDKLTKIVKNNTIRVTELEEEIKMYNKKLSSIVDATDNLKSHKHNHKQSKTKHNRHKHHDYSEESRSDTYNDDDDNEPQQEMKKKSKKRKHISSSSSSSSNNEDGDENDRKIYKKCTQCDSKKRLTDFAKNSRAYETKNGIVAKSCGRRSSCKDCDKKRQRLIDAKKREERQQRERRQKEQEKHQ